ncbi:hypothetical protein Tco_0571591 [Tanacetum coccineum]
MDPYEFEAPQSLEQAPPSPDYVSGPEYPEYLAPSDDEIPVEYQHLPVDASPTSLSLGYVADSDSLEEDPGEDPEEDPTDYLANKGDDEEEEKEESSEDDDEEEEASEEDEEDEHLTLADSAALPAIDPVPSTEETKLFETNESAATPPPPRLPQTRYASAPTPPSPPPSPLSPLLSPLPKIPSPPLLLPPPHTSPTYASAPLGNRAAMVQLRATSPLPVPSSPLLLPSVDRRSDIPKADMLFQKRLCLTASASRFEVGESLTAAAARQTEHTLARRVDYGFIDTLDASIRAFEGRVMTTIGEVNERVTDLATTQRQDAHKLYVRCEDAQDDRALLRAQISLLTKERRYFCSMASSYEREAVYT